MIRISGMTAKTPNHFGRSKCMLYIGLILSSLLFNCTSDKKSEIELIQGTWVLKEATRNDKNTRSLDGMYMQFEGEQSFDSNILGDSSSFSFQLDGQQILVDHNFITSFDIMELSDSTLKLATKINEDKIQLVFNK